MALSLEDYPTLLDLMLVLFMFGTTVIMVRSAVLPVGSTVLLVGYIVLVVSLVVPMILMRMIVCMVRFDMLTGSTLPVRPELVANSKQRGSLRR